LVTVGGEIGVVFVTGSMMVVVDHLPRRPFNLFFVLVFFVSVFAFVTKIFLLYRQAIGGVSRASLIVCLCMIYISSCVGFLTSLREFSSICSVILLICLTFHRRSSLLLSTTFPFLICHCFLNGC
jgi:hypothetical protein